MKDYFSGHSKIYATFRPTYPDELYNFILNDIPIKQTAWDCGTGNGQVAKRLARDFRNVFATDISLSQLKEAEPSDTISYLVAPAEKTNFESDTFDLITVAQALHWFDVGEFYNEVRRVGKPGATIAVWGYSFLSISPDIDRILLHFYTNVVGPYWDNARKLVEEEYRSIPFPFDHVQKERFAIRTNWSLSQLSGYLVSWSATQTYMLRNQLNPVPSIIAEITKHWGIESQMPVSFPVFVLKGTV